MKSTKTTRGEYQSEAAETFELREVCNTLLAELKTVSHNQNIIKLSVDIQLPIRYNGDPSSCLSMIQRICAYLFELLINGVIHIELTSKGIYHSQVGVHVLITGFGSIRNIILNHTAHETILQNSEFEITHRSTEDLVTYEFDYTLKSNNVESNNAKLPFERKKILIAEDNEINAMVFSSFLEEWGVETSTAINGADAVSQVHDIKFDAILMDIHMPILNGNEATKKIRDFNSDIPIIALTASTNEYDYQEAINCGVNDYLVKPVSSANLFQVLSKYL
jgi:CheY-like chemotaxis protein